MGGVGQNGCLHQGGGGDEPPGWVPALGMRGMRVRCPWGFLWEGGTPSPLPDGRQAGFPVDGRETLTITFR